MPHLTEVGLFLFIWNKPVLSIIRLKIFSFKVLVLFLAILILIFIYQEAMMMHDIDRQEVLDELKERITAMVDSENVISQFQIDNILNEIINTRELQLRQDIYVLADTFIEDKNNFERLAKVPMPADTSVEENSVFYKVKAAEKIEEKV
jgi:hypothetical protein